MDAKKPGTWNQSDNMGGLLLLITSVRSIFETSTSRDGILLCVTLGSGAMDPESMLQQLELLEL